MGTVPRPPRPGKSLAELKPSKALEWDYEKNYPYTPETIGANSASLFWWLCPVDPAHAWQQSANGRRERLGCPGCSGQRTFKGSNDLATTHPELCLEWHPENRLTPAEVTRGSDYRAKWICSKDQRHLWETTPYERTREQSTGCPACAGRMVIAGVNDLVTTHPHLASEWCITLNGGTSSAIPTGSHKKVWWRCSTNNSHVWKTSVGTRTGLKTGCPDCNEKGKSRVEERLRELIAGIRNIRLLNNRTVDLRWNKKTTAKLDILGEMTGGKLVVVEFDGMYWHQNRVQTDTCKTKALLAAGYTVIRVREYGLPDLKIEHHDFYQFPTDVVTPQNSDYLLPQIVERVQSVLSNNLRQQS